MWRHGRCYRGRVSDTRIDFRAGAPVTGTFDVDWIHGSRSRRHNTDPPIQVHAYEPTTLILRQNKCLNYEGPFLYLFVGTQKALQLMNARRWDRPLLEELSQAMLDASICGLGQAAPNPVLSVLKYFPGEVE